MADCGIGKKAHGLDGEGEIIGILGSVEAVKLEPKGHVQFDMLRSWAALGPGLLRRKRRKRRSSSGFGLRSALALPCSYPR